MVSDDTILVSLLYFTTLLPPTKGGSMDAEGVPCICFVGRLSIADDFSTDDGIA